MFLWALYLWKNPIAVAKKLIPADHGATIKSAVTVEELQALSFSVIGFWIAIWGGLHILSDGMGFLEQLIKLRTSFSWKTVEIRLGAGMIWFRLASEFG